MSNSRGRIPIEAPDAQIFVRLAGGCSKVARSLGIKRSAVSNWKQVPANRVLKLEDMLNGEKSRHDMRPDVFGKAA